jgi:hypothetical protein
LALGFFLTRVLAIKPHHLQLFMAANPISLTALWENFWVFTLYGVVMGLGAGGMSLFNADLSKAEALMMEPLSFYAFSSLSLFGLIGLGLASVTVAPNAKAMHNSVWVRGFWVPIANAGLSTGAIVMGMMLGLSIGLLPSALTSPNVWKLVCLLFFMAIFVFAVLYPLTWFKRSLFDLTKEDERKSLVTGILYCLAIGLSFWHIDKEKFWWFITVIGAFSVIIGWLIKSFSASKQQAAD